MKKYDICFRSGLEEGVILYLLQKGFTVHVEKPFDRSIERIESLNQLHQLNSEHYIQVNASLRTNNPAIILDELCRYSPSFISATKCD